MGLDAALVGHRVVVRRLLREEIGPTGGPAFTDVLGILERYDADRVEVRRADGSLVGFPSGDVVAGKPVPEQPVRRVRKHRS